MGRAKQAPEQEAVAKAVSKDAALAEARKAEMAAA